MPDLKPGPGLLHIRILEVEDRLVKIYLGNGTIGSNIVPRSQLADVSELVEALRPFAAIKFWPDKRPDVQGDSIKAEHIHRARAALAKFEAAND
jgi:antitoxin component of MazEF toxin-antitoxin module